MKLDSTIMASKRAITPFDENKHAFETAAKATWDSLKFDPELTGSVEVNVTLAHWRDASQIHGWFVENIQDGEDDQDIYVVPREDLQELVELCKQALGDKDRAGELLPPTVGVFFGEKNIDEAFFEQLQEVIDDITRILEDPNYKDWEFEYISSW